MIVNITKYKAIGILFILPLIGIGCQKKNNTIAVAPFSILNVESKNQSTNAAVEIVSPSEESIVGDSFESYFIITGFSDDGDHLHYMLDDGDIIEHANMNSPVKLEGVRKGAHALRAIAVGKDHVSYKSTKSVDVVNFYVEEKGPSALIDNSKPMLLLNLPSGSYESSQQDSVVLDFWLSNAKLGLYDYKIGYSLDGFEGTLPLWKTSVISELSNGKHKLILDLIDPNGKIVLGNLNHTVRTFVVN